ncbi:7003_t:CDS:1, partial [Racocetra fulgida]
YYNFGPVDFEELDDYAEGMMCENPEINKFIRENDGLKWIPYEQLSNIEYLAHGGFGVVSKARWNFLDVALKCLNNSKNLTADVLQEITNYRLFDHSTNIIYVSQCYGLSQDPTTGNYLMVMHYFEGGNLRQYLDNNHNQLFFEDKLGLLYTMANGLYHIHSQGLIHRDFHPGNILNRFSSTLYFKSLEYNKTMQNIGCYITDLGLCKPIDEANDDKTIYGVLPYVAPEILRGKQYTQASDIYSFGIVAYELFSGLPPYYNVPHNTSLTINICNGLRPNSDIINVPQLLKKLIIKCWDDNPLVRPTASELFDLFGKWYCGQDEEFCRQYRQIDDAEKLMPLETYKIHPQAIYTSRLLNLNLKENDYVSNKLNELHIEDN